MHRSTALARHPAARHALNKASPWPARFETAIAMAVALLTDGRATEARAALVGLKPSRATRPVHATMIGLVYAAIGANAEALVWFERALAIGGPDPTVLVHRATCLAALDAVPEAIEGFAAAFAAGATDAEASYTYGNLLRRTGGRLAQAIAAYDRALQLRPAYPEALRAGASVLRELGRPEAALRFIDEAIRLRPDDLDARLDRTALLHAQERFAEALAGDEEALRLMPGQAALLNNRGIAQQELGDLSAACESFSAAARADPALAQAHLNGGNALVWLGFPDEALAAFDRALALRPAYPDAHVGRGLSLKMLGRLADSLTAFETALIQDPASAYARANLGELHLLLGHFERGWPDYEDRFKTGRYPKPQLRAPVPAWTGPWNAAAGITVIADQGRGDMIHFARYLPLLADAGHDVTFICPARMQRVLGAATARVRVLDADDGSPADGQIPMSSLPFAHRTSLATVPGQPYLTADADLVARWAARLGPVGFKIGLCWRGGQAWQADPKRSIPLASLAPLAGRPGVRLISLQMPDNDEATGCSLDDLGIEPLGAELDRGADGFADTAAVMASLDLVVTCDTSIAHLAGALGRPVWLLLQAVPEWRWLLGTDTSPWYPTMRLFRQTERGDWAEPVARLAEAVDTLRRSAAPLCQEP